jgi:hypothetical protein
MKSLRLSVKTRVTRLVILTTSSIEKTRAVINPCTNPAFEDDVEMLRDTPTMIQIQSVKIKNPMAEVMVTAFSHSLNRRYSINTLAFAPSNNLSSVSLRGVCRASKCRIRKMSGAM